MVMDLLIASVADRPDLAPEFAEFPDSWPEFLYHDVVSDLLFDRLMRAHPESYLVAVDPADPHRPLARACALPLSWPSLDELPRGGYDQVLLSAAADLAGGVPAGRIAAALEITVRPDRRGGGMSTRMLGALRHTLVDLGFESLVAPVRPTEKHLYPDESMASYLKRVRPDGLLADPWLRTHMRVGATLAGIAHTSMTIAAPLPEWRQWTGLPFDTDGPVHVPLALAPVHCDLTQQIAVYVEPNVWMHHRLIDR
jgi:hypothetical protein